MQEKKQAYTDKSEPGAARSSESASNTHFIKRDNFTREGLRENTSTGGGSQMCFGKKKKKNLSWRKLKEREPNHI